MATTTIELLVGDKFIVTGVDVRGRRFKTTSDSYAHVRGINVWRGSKWLLRDGKRTLLERIYN